METILPAHPERSLRLVHRSLMLYGASFSRVFVLALFVSFIIFLPRLLTVASGENFVPTTMLSWQAFLVWILDFVALFLFIAIFWRMHCIDRGYHEPMVEDLRVGAKKVLDVFIASIILGILIFFVSVATIGLQYLLHRNNLLFQPTTASLLLTLLVFLGQFLLVLYVSTLFIFYVPLIALENKGVLHALERSVSLAWNHWWRVLTLQLIPWLVYAVVLIIIRNVFHINIKIYFMPTPELSVWTVLLQVVVFSIFLIWAAALLLVQLKDLELRKHLTTKKRHAI